jgi:hypothetical protein
MMGSGVRVPPSALAERPMEQGRSAARATLAASARVAVASRLFIPVRRLGWERHTISSCDGVDIHVALKPSCAAKHQWPAASQRHRVDAVNTREVVRPPTVNVMSSAGRGPAATARPPGARTERCRLRTCARSRRLAMYRANAPGRGRGDRQAPITPSRLRSCRASAEQRGPITSAGARPRVRPSAARARTRRTAHGTVG